MTDENWKRFGPAFARSDGFPRKGQRIEIKMLDGQVIDGVVPFVLHTIRADFNWRDMKGNRIDPKKVAAWRPK